MQDEVEGEGARSRVEPDEGVPALRHGIGAPGWIGHPQPQPQRREHGDGCDEVAGRYALSSAASRAARRALRNGSACMFTFAQTPLQKNRWSEPCG